MIVGKAPGCKQIGLDDPVKILKSYGLMSFTSWYPYDRSLDTAAKIAIRDVLAVQEGERVFIVTNPQEEVYAISVALFDAVVQSGGRPLLLVQPVKSQLDFTEPGGVSRGGGADAGDL